MARRLFGTDGVRGVAAEVLTADLALRLARAVTAQSRAQRPQVLLIRDTRESGEMLESALAAGIKTVMLPARNQKDLEDIPPEAQSRLQFVFLEKVEDAIRAALERQPTPAGPAA